MAKLIECAFRGGDILRHKKHKKRYYMLLNRYKNTAFLAEFNPKTRMNLENSRRKVKISTLNFCYELDKTYKVLYGTTKV